jgi:hypothetical protein
MFVAGVRPPGAEPVSRGVCEAIMFFLNPDACEAILRLENIQALFACTVFYSDWQFAGSSVSFVGFAQLCGKPARLRKWLLSFQKHPRITTAEWKFIGPS